ncbi:hypothetical protein [Lactobacillus sp. PV034]|uniref:hypothetical protein n=1 Tax=Lactobacillus sp. PV034 TaxID=2594495 RepID=UPI00223F2778|nr:hypothetical protein [Lactobacillus sp. PV034]QNQ80354.1 hypothetical protein FP432_01690 [Lactobacillus sp. PV034]
MKKTYLLAVTALAGVTLATTTLPSAGFTNNIVQAASKKEFKVKHDKYHKKRVSVNVKNPKAGDYAKIDNGEYMTWIKGNKKLSSYKAKGLKFTNLKYQVFAIENYKNYDQILNINKNDKAVFGKSQFSDPVDQTFVVLKVTTNIENTSKKTITFGGLSGEAKKIKLDKGKKVKNKNIAFDDASSNIQIKPGQKLKNKEMVLVLSYGTDLKSALKKIKSKHLKVTTSGIKDENNKNLGGEKTLNFIIK